MHWIERGGWGWTAARGRGGGRSCARATAHRASADRPLTPRTAAWLWEGTAQTASMFILHLSSYRIFFIACEHSSFSSDKLITFNLWLKLSSLTGLRYKKHACRIKSDWGMKMSWGFLDDRLASCHGYSSLFHNPKHSLLKDFKLICNDLRVCDGSCGSDSYHYHFHYHYIHYHHYHTYKLINLLLN